MAGKKRSPLNEARVIHLRQSVPWIANELQQRGVDHRLGFVQQEPGCLAMAMLQYQASQFKFQISHGNTPTGK